MNSNLNLLFNSFIFNEFIEPGEEYSIHARNVILINYYVLIFKLISLENGHNQNNLIKKEKLFNLFCN